MSMHRDGHDARLAPMEEPLAPQAAESILMSLAAAIFPTGLGKTEQVSWEGTNGQAPVAAQDALTPEQRSLAQLRAAELRYRTLVEQIPAVTFMAVLGEGQNEIYVSPHIEALLGFTQKEWLENPFLWFSQLHPEDQQLLYEEFASGCRTGGPFRAECRVFARDGRIVWIRGEARLLKDELGRPLFLQGVAFDITESKQAQAILLQKAVETTEERYRDIVEQLGAIFWEVEPSTGRFTFVSRGAERILGYSPEDWIRDASLWLSRVHADDRARVRDRWTALLHTGGDDEIEFRAETADGRVIWLHQRVHVPPPTRADARAVGVMLDVTDKKQAEEQLRLNATRLEAEAAIRRTLHRIGTELASQLTLEHVVQLATDETTTLTTAQFGAFFYNVVNESGEAYTLYTLSGVPREAFAKFPMPRNTAVFAATFTGVGVVRLDDVTTDSRYGHNAPYHGMPEGHLPVRSYLAVPVVSRSGAVLGGMFFGHSKVGVFTEEHEQLAVGIAGWTALAIDNATLYASAEKAREAAETANRAKDEFLATMSHELRTPLNAVLGWVQVLRTASGTPENRNRALATIERNARSQAQIIDDLLDVSRIVTGKLALKSAPVELLGVIDGALETVSLAVHAKPLTLTKHIDVASAIVSGDADRLRQVITNLLTNAVKFTPPGGQITVRLDADDDTAIVQVADTGQGIHPALLSHVFDRFWQGDNSITRTHGGLGLGLAIVKHIVEMHGGEVSAQSAGAGVGTTFTVKLPLGTRGRDQRLADATDAAATAPVAALKNVPIVVIDDEADARELVTNVLEGAGARVRSVASAADGLRACRDNVPDLVICDLGMPSADGFEFLRQLRALGGRYARTPAIALTAYAREEDRQKALDAGFQAHIGKPFDVARLVHTAAALLLSR
jgi:PAS domain S-box-containing protein